MRSRILAAGALLLVLPAAAAAQVAPPVPDSEVADLSEAEIERLFDAYAIVQAQEMLRLNDAQYGQFVTRLKELQELRRRQQRERDVLMQGLARLTAQNPPPDEGLLRDRLKTLEDYDARTSASMKEAYHLIDEVLTIPQRARFRVFEDQMERRKLQLLLRARQ